MKTCYKCKKEIKPDGLGTGYGIYNNHKYCYPCCATLDKQNMEKDNKIVLYLSKDNCFYSVSNWPGTLKIKVDYFREGRHNIAGVRRDVWFHDHKGVKWHGVCYGDFTQLLHCRKLKVS